MSKTLEELASEVQLKNPKIKIITSIIDLPSGICQPQIVHKRWGGELIYANEDYCMKLLQIKANCRTSMHFHVIKAETLMVIEGNLQVDCITKEGDRKTIHLSPYNAFTVNPGFPHQLIALEQDVLLVEASTPDHPNDSVRVGM